MPDVDFLATFAEVTGADFHQLLRVRLASGKTEAARRLAETLDTQQAAHKPLAELTMELLEAVKPTIDQELIGEIAVKLEKAYLQSGGLLNWLSAFFLANPQAAREALHSLTKATTREEIKVDGLARALSETYPAYVGGLTALAASVYNEVALIPPGPERQAAITRTIMLITAARNLSLAPK